MNSPENSSAEQTIASLQEQLNALRKCFTITLWVLLFFTAAIDLYLVRQVMNVRGALGPQTAVIEQFKTSELPNITKFTENLKAYAQTHPDINPILAKYGLSITNAPGASTAVKK